MPANFTGSLAISGSLLLTGSITTTGGITISGSIDSASFAATASSADNFVVRQNLTGSNVLATGTITAQTLVVQTVTSSIVYSSGSNIFGNQLTNVQQFTGSVRVTGSFNTIGNACITSVCSPSIIGDTVCTTIGNFSCVGIGTMTPANAFNVSNNGASGFEVSPTGGINSGVLLQAYNRSTSAYMAQSYYACTHTFNVGGGGATRALDISNTGIACFACQVCAPHFIAVNNISIGSSCTVSDGYNTRLRITCLANDTFVFSFNNQACKPIMFMYGGNTSNPQGYTAWVDNTTNNANHKLSHITTDATYFAAQGGRVGIGTTTPCTVLSVNSGISVSSANAISIMQNTNGANKDAAAFGIAVGNGGESTNAADLFISTATGGALCERMRITSGGNVGIGCASPSYVLDVRDGTTGSAGGRGMRLSVCSNSAGPQFRLEYQCSGNSRNWLIGTNQEASGDFIIRSSTVPGCDPGGSCSITRFSISKDGCVGIGIAFPTATLTVEGANSAFPLTYNSGYGNVHIQTNETTATQNFGGTLTFGGLGRTSGPTEKFIWAAIAGRKQTTTSGDAKGYLQFGTLNDDTNQIAERMRITACGILKVQNSGVTYENSTAGVNEIGTCANDTNLVFRNVRGSLTGARAGVDVFYAFAQPNSADASFYEAADSTDGSTRTLRFKVASNGTVYSRCTSITPISSDIRLKTDIVDYDKGLAEVISMKPRYFKYKDNLCEIHSGFIAQEINEALPGVMFESYKDQDCNPVMTYQVDWYPLLVNAIKQQQCQICTQSIIIDQLKTCLGII